MPGGPTSSTPLGIFAPISLKMPGSRRKSMTSLISCFTPTDPATSAKVVCGRSVVYTFARLRPMDMTPPSWLCARRPIHT